MDVEDDYMDDDDDIMDDVMDNDDSYDKEEESLMPVNASLTVDDIEQKHQDDISTITQVLEVPESTAMILLRHYKWDKDKIINSFLEGDAVAICRNAGAVHPSEFKLLQTQSIGTQCPICFDVCDVDNSVVLGCGHRFTTDCLTQYFDGKISEKDLYFQCPVPKCGHLVTSDIIEKYLTEEMRSKYKQFLRDAYVEDNPNVRWCPRPGCNLILDTDNVWYGMVACGCGYMACVSCNNEGHAPASCENVVAWKKKCQDDSETYNWILTNTKNCPKCERAIEKNDHMTCKVCKHEFCWVCGEDWKSHTDYYSCNRFKASADSKQDENKFKLQKYLFHYERYMNHQRSLNEEFKLREKARKIQNVLQSGHVPFIIARRITLCCEQLLRCRSTLRWTYVYGYYCDENKKELFEFLQRDLERSTEMLSEFLEQKDVEKDVNKVVNPQFLMDINVASKRLDNLLRACEQGVVQIENIQSIT